MRKGHGFGIFQDLPSLMLYRAYGNFGRGVLYCNFADQECYRETIYSLLGCCELKDENRISDIQLYNRPT